MSSFFSTVKNKKVAFIGAGVSHKMLIPMFAAAGAKVTLCDKKSRAKLGRLGDEYEALGVQMCLGENYLTGLLGQDIIMRTPGFAFFTKELQEAGEAGAIITSEIELFFKHCPCPIIGITGSDGKTTTSSLIAAMYEAAGRCVHLGGNIGTPLLPIIDIVKPEDIAVVELSSFQLISMRQSPHVAVVTNIAPNHLDHHKDMDEYINAKRNILLWQNESDTAILGAENDITRTLEKDVKGECRWFSRLRPVGLGAYLRRDDGMLCFTNGTSETEVINTVEMRLRGDHNIENMLCAIATVYTNVPLEAIRKVARSFKGVEHRIEPVRTLNGVKWFNDSIASSPTRVIAGLRSFNQKLILIAGGHSKNLDYSAMVPDLLKKVKLIILTGPAGIEIENAIYSNSAYEESGLTVLRAENMQEAVAFAYKYAQKGDIVTLSPGAASFDAYENFEERGRHYKKLVNEL